MNTNFRVINITQPLKNSDWASLISRTNGDKFHLAHEKLITSCFNKKLQLNLWGKMQRLYRLL